VPVPVVSLVPVAAPLGSLALGVPLVLTLLLPVVSVFFDPPALPPPGPALPEPAPPALPEPVFPAPVPVVPVPVPVPVPSPVLVVPVPVPVDG